MAYNLLSCERDQSYLMPPSMRDWLSEGHLAWFIVDAVGQMDLREFYAVYPNLVDGVQQLAQPDKGVECKRRSCCKSYCQKTIRIVPGALSNVSKAFWKKMKAFRVVAALPAARLPYRLSH